MKTGLVKSLAMASIALAVTQTALAKDYSPEALQAVIQHAKDSVQQGRVPIVMFDLDDTLINTRERNLRILEDFAAQGETQAEFPQDGRKIQSLAIGQIQFLLADTLKSVDVTNADLIKKATDFWLARFFTNEYCAKDVPNPGAAKYLHLLSRAGAKIVYLTGRDTPRMGEGTRQNLIRNRFPMNPDHAILIMKPDPKMDDLKFKESQYESIAAMGEVIAAFENEPANINSMAHAFPNAQAIFLDTIHSPKPDVPEDRVDWVQDFNLNRVRRSGDCATAAVALAVQQGVDDTVDPELGYPTKGSVYKTLSANREYIIQLDTGALYDVTTSLETNGLCEARTATPY